MNSLGKIQIYKITYSHLFYLSATEEQENTPINQTETTKLHQ